AGSRTLGLSADRPRPRCAGPRRSAWRQGRTCGALCAASRARRPPSASATVTSAVLCVKRVPPPSHAGARGAADTDWPRIAALYDRLRVVAPSPVVDLNRAIAHSMAFGPEAGLRLLGEIADGGALRDYAPLPAARGDFLFRAGRLAEARSEFQAAAALTRNARERAFLLARADACDDRPR